jgi:hypothetical protein
VKKVAKLHPVIQAWPKDGEFCIANSIASLNSSYSPYNNGIYNVTPQVFAVGNLPAVNSSAGVESKPNGGGWLAPVANINTSARVMADSPSIKQKEEAYSTVSTSDFKAKVGPSSDTYTCIHILHGIRDRVLGFFSVIFLSHINYN